MREAFEDMGKKGYAWNNFMLQRWSDHNKVEHRVVDDYARNVMLIDLNAQPQDIKDRIDITISDEVATPKRKQMVGAHFLKFCGHHNLQKLSEQATTFGQILNAPYPE